MANVYQDPFRAFRFLVELENGSAVVAAFSQFSGVKFEVQSVKARSGDDTRGVLSGVPTLTSFSPVTLTKGVVGDEAFLDWLFAAAVRRGQAHNQCGSPGRPGEPRHRLDAEGRISHRLRAGPHGWRKQRRPLGDHDLLHQRCEAHDKFALAAAEREVNGNGLFVRRVF